MWTRDTTTSCGRKESLIKKTALLDLQGHRSQLDARAGLLRASVGS